MISIEHLFADLIESGYFVHKVICATPVNKYAKAKTFYTDQKLATAELWDCGDLNGVFVLARNAECVPSAAEITDKFFHLPSHYQESVSWAARRLVELFEKSLRDYKAAERQGLVDWVKELDSNSVGSVRTLLAARALEVLIEAGVVEESVFYTACGEVA